MIDFEKMTYEEGRDLKETLADFLKHPGWEFVKSVVEERTKIRHGELTSLCPASIEQMAGYNRIFGGIEELRLLPVLIEQIYSDLTTELKRLQDEVEGELDFDAA